VATINNVDDYQRADRQSRFLEDEEEWLIPELKKLKS
jgi:hypothetical protein